MATDRSLDCRVQERFIWGIASIQVVSDVTNLGMAFTLGLCSHVMLLSHHLVLEELNQATWLVELGSGSLTLRISLGSDLGSLLNNGVHTLLRQFCPIDGLSRTAFLFEP